MTAQPSFFKAWTEPESAANTDYQPVYPHNNITQTPSGHSFELDDTPTRERVRLQHRSGTFIEMHPNGDEVHKVYGDGYEITIKDKNVHIKGTLNITVDGDALINVKGDLIEQVDGNVEQHIKGNYTQVIEGQASVTSVGDYNMQCGGLLGGGLKLQTGDYFHLDGDLSIGGELIAQKITSKSRVDAMYGMSAGPAGFVTETGGISVGIPYATPLEITCVGPIMSFVSMSAPLATFGIANIGIMSAVLMTDVMNSRLYNCHFHPDADGGFTGSTVLKFVGGI